MQPDSTTSHAVYLLFDGDDVGAQIELHLLEDEPELAAQFSKRVTEAILALAGDLMTHLGAEILFAAGDEVLVRCKPSDYDTLLSSLSETFYASTGVTLSCGIGSTSREAAANLRFAKLKGKNRHEIGPSL